MSDDNFIMSISSNTVSNSQSVYEGCALSLSEESPNGTEPLLECVADKLETLYSLNSPPTSDQSDELPDSLTQFLFILTGSLVFFMQTGFAMLCAGCVRKKSAENTMLKNLLDCCGSALAFYAVGYAFAFGGHDTGTTFVGTTNFLNIGLEEENFGFWFFQYTFSAAAVTIVAGTIAERCQMTAYLFYSVFLSGFVYPVVAHSVWSKNGFLSSANADPLLGIGMIDFAGSGVVHLTGGFTALFATCVLGSRRGRFFDLHSGKPLEKPLNINGHSVSLQILGTMCLWFGWYGFNSGSALLISQKEYRAHVASLTAVNTSLSAVSGGITALFVNLTLEERRTGEYHFDLRYAMNGCLSGLVGITAGCGTLENWAAVVVGFVSGLLYIWTSSLLIRFKIDDAVDAIPVHLTNGVWGVLATGLFSSPRQLSKAYGNSEHVGFFYSFGNGSADGNLLACQVIGVLFISGWCVATMLPFFRWLNFMGWFRTDVVEEIVGLDGSHHGRDSNLQDYDDEYEDHLRNEYLSAYERYKKNSKSRKSIRRNIRNHDNDDDSDNDDDDDDDDDDDSV